LKKNKLRINNLFKKGVPKGHPFYMRGIFLLFSVFIRGEIKKPAAYNQAISLKSKTDCQKTSFIVSPKSRKNELKSVS